MEKYALFIYESLKKTKCREFVPSRDEIEALIRRQEVTSMVYCHGGGSCKITINSHTTAGEVRAAPLTPVHPRQGRCAGRAAWGGVVNAEADAARSRPRAGRGRHVWGRRRNGRSHLCHTSETPSC